MPDFPVRKRMRLKDYRYDLAGAYFVTVNVKDRLPLLGKVINGVMHHNAAGEMVRKWYLKLEDKFPDIWCGPAIVMPDHFHAIIINRSLAEPNPFHLPNLIEFEELPKQEEIPKGDLVFDKTNLSKVMQWFKTMTTNEYIRGVKTKGWPRFNGKLWQRGYYEMIVKSESMFERVADYIICNAENYDRR